MGEDRWAGLGTVVVIILAVTVTAGLLAISRANSDDSDVAAEDPVVDEPEPVEEEDEDDVVVEDSPDELWTAHEDATVHNLVSDGETVCAAAELELFCVDAETGEDIFTTDLPGIPVPLVLAGETLVVAVDGGDGNGDVYGYSLTGERLWQAVEIYGLDHDDEWNRSLLIVAAAGDTVAVVAGAYGHSLLVGLDATTGAERWRAQEVAEPQDGLSDTGLAGEIFSDGTRFYAAVQEPYGDESRVAVVAIDPATGAEQWRITQHDEGVFGLGGVALVDADTTFLLVDPWFSGQALAVDPATGTVQWEYLPEEDESEGMAASLDEVTVVKRGEEIVGLDAGGGEAWRTDASDLTIQKLVVQDGELYGIGTEVCTIDPDTGEVTVVYDDGGLDLVVVGDVLVVANAGLTAIPAPG